MCGHVRKNGAAARTALRCTAVLLCVVHNMAIGDNRIPCLFALAVATFASGAATADFFSFSSFNLNFSAASFSLFSFAFSSFRTRSKLSLAPTNSYI